MMHHHVQMPGWPAQRYGGGIDAESLDRYEPGGYHPVALGDVLKDGRYKILHKLGWGGHATTWAAKDQKDDRYVAVKIMVSKIEESRELKMLRALSALPKDHPGSSYVNQMLDHFTHVGPNGTHNCLVLELVGPNVAEFVEYYRMNNRLPAKLAKLFAKQTLQGLDFLATNNIGHGDLHTGNLAIVVPGLDALNEEDFIASLGKFETGAVTKLDDGPWAPNVPTEIIRPALFQGQDIMAAPCPSIKIIDFGEAFFGDDAPSTLKTPRVLQAPEIVFGDRLDLRVDLWSAGCLIFDLVSGYRPLDAWWSQFNLVRQMIAATSEELPSRWQAKWRAMQREKARGDGGPTLQKWLEQVYFHDENDAEFTMEEIACVTKAIAGLLRLEPSLRATARESLAHNWFQ
ncbi:related to dis1-suppressing protein kinase dsk1 [Claviceps purpurea 20.1]|uniref:non-specific serine/threonine protein kinase n=1 Tax=Claviceps purpurea (strain 20.1) TaxID=1111077 RepID=M1W8Q5_CLAP2|nr:related to dis1-suppressing protein kinase dsk1 [Claviceps purpurea 20.1]